MTARHVLLPLAAALASVCVPIPVRALDPPSGCVPYSSAGDYACAGLHVPYHTSGAERSEEPIWAGQWLFTDDGGEMRIGSCVFNRGLHPRADDPARPTAQTLPHDPDGTKSAYLTWRYGSTTDDLTAAALWAVFHYYAQDPAGSARSVDPAAPLVPVLDRIAAATGREDLQRRAIDLDAEASRIAGSVELVAEVDGRRVTLQLTAGGRPLAGIPLRIEGGSVVGLAVEVPAGILTDTAGLVVVEAAAGATVRASTTAPGPAVIFQAEPLHPHPFGGQTLLTTGPATDLHVSATIPPPPTTTSTTTTVPPTTLPAPPRTPPPTAPTTVAPTTTTPTTTTPSTTTTAPSTTTIITTTEPPPTEPPPTEPPPTTRPVPSTAGATSTTPPVVTATVVPPTTVPVPATLPETGSAGTVAAAGALTLGAGVGALVGLRRRLRSADDLPWP